jgi:hypothetical protein
MRKLSDMEFHRQRYLHKKDKESELSFRAGTQPTV